jgi:cation transport ATPase
MASALSPAPGTVESTAGSSALCPGCGHPVDQLRAGHVAVLDGRFHYFCHSGCKHAYLASRGLPQEEEIATAHPPDVIPESGDFPVPAVEATGETAQATSLRNAPGGLVPAQPPDEAREALASHLVFRGPSPDGPVAFRGPSPDGSVVFRGPSPETGGPGEGAAGRKPLRPGRSLRDTLRQRTIHLLEASGIALGCLAPALGLLGPAADAVRAQLVACSWLALAIRASMVGRDPADPHALVVLGPTGVAAAAACYAYVIHDPHAGALAAFAGLSCAAAVAIEVLVARAWCSTWAARKHIECALDVRARAVREHDTVELSAVELRPGEQVVAVAGETLGVDATVTAGEARVVPWLDAPIEMVKREGDPVVAGARVVSSRLRVTTTWSGRERAWLRLLGSPSLRLDVAAPTPRFVRLAVERGAPAAALCVGAGALAANATAVEIVAAMSAGAIAFGARAVASAAALHFARAHLEALRSGVTYKDARAFERAAGANIAVFSARGTVLLGEPEIVAIEPLGAFDVERVLALAAGAERASTHPFAAAVLRAARARGVRADHVRNATAHAGLGITALASTGERLVVGGRAIMLEEKIGVAAVDARVSELEGEGRSVLLVALADRLAGLVALQDGLRQGARAAVQRLHDVRIEPVLMSGEARDTCETIGRALDIEHVRPEVLPAERGAEVRALGEGGGTVAVVGHPAADDAALGAADVAIAMGAAGSTPGEWAIALAGDDVRDAALALAIPHAARDRARRAVVLGATPGLLALLAIAFGVAPLGVAPLAVLAGALAVTVHAREA